MAIIIPSLSDIKSREITKANLNLLERLEKGLSSDFEVFYKPILNGFYPDIVIYKESNGIVVINTVIENYNDFNYGSANIFFQNIKDNFVRYSNNYDKTLLRYKLFKKASEYNNDLKSNLSSNPLSIIKSALYFCCLNQDEVRKLKDSISKSNDVIFWSSDSRNIINDIINKMKVKNIYFNPIIKSLRLQLNPSIEKLDLDTKIIFNSQQIKLSEVSYPEEKKIRGTAGSGKSLVLAQKAINAYKKTNQEVLILCFNITLVNYIRLQIKRLITEEIEDKFYIVHFHDFIRNLSIKYGIYTTYAEESRFKNHKLSKTISMLSSMQKLSPDYKYKTVLIDEGQDFELHWFNFIKESILLPGGSYSIFGDSKQNIYQIEQENDDNAKRNIKTNILGRWNELKQGYRFGNNIKKFSLAFHHKFLSEHILLDSESNDYSDLLSNQDYVYLKEVDNKDSVFENVNEALNFLVQEHEINQNDISIIGFNIDKKDDDEQLQKLDAYLRLSKERYNTITVFESIEEKEYIDNLIFEVEKSLLARQQLEGLFHDVNEIRNKDEYVKFTQFVNYTLSYYRQNKKRRFIAIPESIKISTVHSFKGWESYCVILVVTEGIDLLKLKELIYVGITRAKEILYIINLNPELSEFFKEVAQSNPFIVFVE